MAVKISKELTVSNILDSVTEYDIFNTYCTPFKALDRFFKSELREDNKPTCKVFVNEHNALIYHDFNGSSHNCFTYVKEKLGVDFNTTLNIINRDFKLGLRSSWSSDKVATDFKPKIYNGKKRNGPKVTVLKKRRRDWQKQDRDYWFDRYSITESTLDYFNVEPIDNYWINERRFKCDNNTYCFEFGHGSRDVYAPLREVYRWPASTTHANNVYGLKQLPRTNDILFIVSSLKECMFLYEMGICAVAGQSETTAIPEEVMVALKLRFETIIICYDFDTPGILASIKHAKLYDLPRMKFCPVMIQQYDGKDLTDAFYSDNDKIIKLIENYEYYI